MSKRLTRICLAALLAMTAFGGGRAAPADTAESPQHVMLWSVRGASNTVYLLGSVHLLRPEHYPLDPRMEAAYADSQVLVTEVDIARLAEPDVQQLVVARGELPAGQTLRDVISPATLAGTEKLLADMGIDPAAFETHKPWLLAMTLTMAKLTQMGFDPDQGVDVHFDARARRDGKPIVALESVEQQLAIFDDLSPEDSEGLLRFTILEVNTIGTEIDRLITAWQTGDFDSLQAILLEGFGDGCDFN